MRPKVKLNELVIAANQNVKEKEYWLNKLSGELIKSAFPYDYNRKASTRIMETVPFAFSRELYDRLMALSKESDRKLNMILAAGLAALLHKYSDNTDIIIGTPIYNQNVQGNFINTVLTLRLEVNEQVTFKELLLNTRQTLMEAIEHRNFPVEMLAEQLKLPTSHHDDFSLFDVAVLLENIHDKRYIDYIPCNLIFSFLKTRESIEGVVEYNSARYKKTSIVRIINHFTCLMESVLFNVDLTLSVVSILAETEKQQILFEFNHTQTPHIRDKCYQQLFVAQVLKSPDRIAAVHGPHQITYGKLNEEANRMAHLLTVNGGKAGTIIALYMRRSIKILTAIMGIFKSGAAYLPIESDYPRERLKRILEDSGVDAVVTGEDLKESLAETWDMEKGTKHIFCLSREEQEDEILDQYSVSNPECVTTSDQLAYIIYTSGSTGKPKGVMIHQLGMINHLFAKINDLTIHPDDIIAQTASICFDISIWQFLSGLLVGGVTLIIDKEMVLEPLRLLRTLQKTKVTIMESVPSLMSAFLQLVKNEKNKNLKHLRWMIPTGEELDVHLVREWFRYFPGTKIVNAYGPTEASDDVTHYFMAESPPGDQDRIPIGKPIQNTHIYIMDKHLSLCPIGVKGEICVAGLGVGKGYFQDPVKTAKAFVPNPLIDEIGDEDYGILYKTGDMGCFRENGNVEIFGRSDFQVKIRGNRIELGEIENCILNYDGIKKTIVLAKNGDGSNGDKYLCAYLTAEKEVSETQLKNHLTLVLPDYMIPSCFVQLDTFPLTDNGKIDRKALPEPQLEAGETYVPPRNKLEEKLVELWAEVLEIEKNIIGIDSDFFELGGHSLRATILTSKIHKALSVKVPLPEIFRRPRIRSLAEYIEQSEKEQYISIIPMEKREYYPLSSAQERLFILQQLDFDNASYNMMQMIQLPGNPDQDKLKITIQQLIRRHETLRTSFALIGDQPVQRIHPDVGDFEILYFNLEGLGREQIKDMLETPQARDFLRPFQLSAAPLLRVVAARINDDLSVILMNMHHIISDGISQEVLEEDLLKISRGETLSPLKLHYKEFCHWQNSDTVQQSIKKQEEFWLKTFADEISILNFPYDYPRPAVWSAEGKSIPFKLGEQELKALNKMVLIGDTTLFVVLFSIFNIMVHKLSNQDDIVIGIPVIGRRHVDLERIVGMFVNTLALRNFPESDQTFKEFLHQVNERSIAAFEYQEYQFEDLVESLSVRRDTSRNPIYDIMFVFQNVDDNPNELVGDLSPYLESIVMEYEYKRAKFDLTLYATAAANHLSLSFEYSTNLFKTETIERFIRYFKNTAASVISNPDKKISKIEIMTEKEKKQVIFDFNDTQADYPSQKPIHRLFEEQVENTPGNVAVYHEASQVTYSELNAKANHLAWLLRQQGITVNDTVGILAEHSIEIVVGLLGVLKAGGTYVPIDIQYPDARKQFILEDSGAKALLIHKDSYEQYKFLYRELPVNHFVCLDNESYDGEEYHNPEIINRPQDLAYVIYTSGTTGKPKGAMIEHQGVVNYIFWAISCYVRNEAVNFPLYTSISFDLTVTSIFTPLLSGNAVVVYSGDDKFLVEKVINENRVDVVKLTPSHLNIVKEMKKPKIPSRFKRFILGGEEVSTQLALDIHQYFKGNIEIYNEYGPTETVVGCMIYQFNPRENNGQSLSIGVPINNTRIYILDSRQNPLPIGVTGEICISGDGVARGYLKREKLTAEKFLENPFENGKRLYRSGDLGRWRSDGNVEFLGRKDQQVKIRGYRIEPGEIEGRLMSHKEIKDAVVIARDESSSDKSLGAYIVAEREFSLSEIREFLSRELPHYMIPAYFYQVDEIPLTANGKIDRKKLSTQGNILDTGVEFVEPKTELEKKIAAVCKDVLKLERVGLKDNFFDIGGNSLKIILYYKRLREELGLEITVVTLFDHVTIASLVDHLHQIEKQKENNILMKEKEMKKINELSSARERRLKQQNIRKRG